MMKNLNKKSLILFIVVLSAAIFVGQIIRSLIKDGAPETMISVIATLVGVIIGAFGGWVALHLILKYRSK